MKLGYHHEGKVHYINKDLAGSRMIKKGEIEEVLIGLLNSQTFNSGDFQIIDVRTHHQTILTYSIKIRKNVG